LYHFIGKDNLFFHALYFPATLRALNQHFILPYAISCTHYLLFEGQKFSKSKQVGVFAQDMIDSPLESDVWRFYLLGIRPETGDTNFTMNGLHQAREKLRHDFGNLVHRLATTIHKLGGAGLMLTDNYQDEAFESLRTNYFKYMDEQRLHKGWLTLVDMLQLINARVTQQRVWRSENCGQLQLCLAMLFELLHLLFPFTPRLCQRAAMLFQISRARDSVVCIRVALPTPLLPPLGQKQ
jgi:methionyl-tRNA synthetase